MNEDDSLRRSRYYQPVSSEGAPSLCRQTRLLSLARAAFGPCWPATVLAAVLATVLLGGAPTATAERADYIGPEACGACHAEAYASWQASAHARAGEAIQAAPAGPGDNQPDRCLACHTTGEAPAGRAFFGSVTCEACHGPGAGYAPADVMQNPTLARALGLNDLSTPQRRAALCNRCHQAALSVAAFDVERGVRAIEHGDRPQRALQPSPTER